MDFNFNEGAVNFMEPAPAIFVGEIAATDNNFHINICDATIYNISETVRVMFDSLTLKNITFEFNPMTSSWNCSYFPQQYINEVTFMFFMWQQTGRLIIEKMYFSGHRETYDELSNDIVTELREFMNPTQTQTQLQ